MTPREIDEYLVQLPEISEQENEQMMRAVRDGG